MRPEKNRLPIIFARSTPCIAIGILITGFSLFTIYIVLFNPPPHCDMLCPFLALAPIVTCALWSIWLVAWHFPEWRRTSPLKKNCVTAILAFAIGQAGWFFAQ
jgi:hypothetical protein